MTQQLDAITISDRPVGSRQPDAAPLRSMTLGDPGSLGVLAFSTTSFMLGLYNAGLVDPRGAGLVIPVALIFGGFIQVTVAVLEVFRGNVFAAAVFGSFGPFWISYGLIESIFAAQVTEKGGAAALTSGLTVFLSMFTVLAVVFLIASLRTDMVLVAVLGLLVVALVLLILGVHFGDTGLEHVSGYLTLAFAALGWYHGAADVIGFTFGRSVLPTGSLARASG